MFEFCHPFGIASRWVRPLQSFHPFEIDAVATFDETHLREIKVLRVLRLFAVKIQP